MKNSSINIVGKLPAGLVELYVDINEHTKALVIDFLVVGAMARDLILVHGFGSNIARGTRDVDFGINVSTWDEFNALKDSLLQAGYQQDERKVHRLTHKGNDGLPWDIDIVPFGKIADESNSIHWPPEQDFEMKVHGFSEAFKHALNVKISEEPSITIPVASPAGICLLKLVSWLDREIELRAKDAADFNYLIQTYSKIPEISDALYEEGYMEIQEWDELNASAMKLGDDVAAIASQASIKFLENELFKQPDKSEQFAREMQGGNDRSLQQCAERFCIFTKSCLGD